MLSMWLWIMPGPEDQLEFSTEPTSENVSQLPSTSSQQFPVSYSGWWSFYGLGRRKVCELLERPSFRGAADRNRKIQITVDLTELLFSQSDRDSVSGSGHSRLVNTRLQGFRVQFSCLKMCLWLMNSNSTCTCMSINTCVCMCDTIYWYWSYRVKTWLFWGFL